MSVSSLLISIREIEAFEQCKKPHLLELILYLSLKLIWSKNLTVDFMNEKKKPNETLNEY
jgi:hypothetical protein